MALVKYHLPVVCNKYLLTKNISYYKFTFNSATTILSLKVSFKSGKDDVNLNLFTVAFSMLDEVVYCTDCAMFLSAGKQRSFGFFVSKG